MADVKSILKTLTATTGISHALVVGRDGFVIESVGDLSADEVGAVISTAISAVEAMGRDCNQGALFEVMAEFKDGTMIAAPIGRDVVLGIVAGVEAGLGTIRHAVKKNLSALERAL